MGGLQNCMACIALAVLAVLLPTTTARHDNRYQIHQLKKNHSVLRHPKREATCQQSGFTLCPASADGGCCPENYACAISSCYATTAGPTSACGTSGYYNCPLTAGVGACCPVGFLCGRDTEDCLPPAGVYSQSCPSLWFGCASSLGYGCCPDGMICGEATCYGTSLKTLPVSETVTTTNSRGNTITTVVTSSSVISPGPDPSDTSSAAVGGVAKLVPSTVSKLPAIETGGGDGNGGNSGNGLSQAQIGGIVGGAIAFLAIIIVIAAIIIWRLRRTEKAAKAAAKSRHGNSNGEPHSQKSGYGQLSISEVDGTDVDSLRRTRNAHFRARSDSSTAGEQSRSETPNYYGSNASTTPPAWPGYFPQIPRSDAASDGRQSSLDSYGAHHDNGYFPARPSVDSEIPRTHARQWSDASELDGSIVGAHGVSELGSPVALEAARRRSNSSTRPPRAQVRRSSDPSGNSRGTRGEGVTPTATNLGTLAEISELHGYYGSPDIAVGQTAARLNKKNSAISSSPGYDT